MARSPSAPRYHTSTGISPIAMRAMGLCPTCLNRRYTVVTLRFAAHLPQASYRMPCHACTSEAK